VSAKKGSGLQSPLLNGGTRGPGNEREKKGNPISNDRTIITAMMLSGTGPSLPKEDLTLEYGRRDRRPGKDRGENKGGKSRLYRKKKPVIHRLAERPAFAKGQYFRMRQHEKKNR